MARRPVDRESGGWGVQEQGFVCPKSKKVVSVKLCNLVALKPYRRIQGG